MAIKTVRDRLLAGRYRLVEPIDRGGTAEVWRAHDERLDREVAVKLLGREADRAFRERFTNEARRAAAVGHHNIVTVFDEGQDGEDAFIVMEAVRGRTLRDIIAERGPLPPSEASAIVTQIAAALDATHRAGLVHCDVKPANVIVDEDGTAKLTDFGIARAARDSEERELVGTARYIAPERIEGRPTTPRSDVYGLALVAYELLAGRPAFPGVENEDLLRERLASGPPPLRASLRALPDAAEFAVAKGLARDPERRYPTAGAFALALADALADPATPVLRPITRAPRRWPRVDSLLALAIVFALLLGVVLFFARFPGGAGTNAAGSATPAPAAGGVAPRVVGDKLDEAIRALLAAGFNARWSADSTLQAAPCTVGRQSPAPGTPIARGSEVTLAYVPGKDCAKQD